MSAVTAGYVLVGVAWVVMLVPIVRGVVRFFRTTSLRDLIPDIHRVNASDGTIMLVVSGRRASIDPSHWVQITPWCWRRKA